MKIAIAKNVCTGGLPGALMGYVGTITGQKLIHTTRHFQIIHQEQLGATGTNAANRNIGAEAEYFIQNGNASITSNTKVRPLKNVWMQI